MTNTRTKRHKRPGKLRRKLVKAINDAVLQAAKDRAAKRQAAGGGGARVRATRPEPAPQRPAASTWTRPDNPGAAIPPMPAGYTATGWDGRPVTDPAALRFFWARENGYTGPIDQDGHPADDWGKDHSGELEWADGDDQDDTEAGESR